MKIDVYNKNNILDLYDIAIYRMLDSFKQNNDGSLRIAMVTAAYSYTGTYRFKIDKSVAKYFYDSLTYTDSKSGKVNNHKFYDCFDNFRRSQKIQSLLNEDE